MIKKILLALVAVALVAAPAFASVQNVKVSGDINSTFLSRNNFDVGSVDQATDYSQNIFFTQTRLRVDADLTDNVGATVGLINERVWGELKNTVDGGRGAANDVGADSVDINLAYVTLREMLYSPLTVVIGRQNFAFGNSFIIDSAGSNNSASQGGLRGVAEDFTLGTAQDAIRLTFDYNPLTIDLIASKVDENSVKGANPQKDDVTLMGANANYKLGDQWNTVVEGYFWTKIDNSADNNSAITTGTQAKGDSIYLPGVHVSTNPVKELMLSGELALQRGNKAVTDGTGAPDNVQRDAVAGQFIANYAIPLESTAKWSPVLTAVYTYTSGQEGAGSPGSDQEGFSAWDPMFENQGGGSIYNTLFNLTNSHIYLAKASFKPMEDVTAWASWTGMWLAREVATGAGTGQCIGASCFTLVQPDGSTINPRVSTNKHLGDEIGVGATYAYTEDVSFGARADMFFPGAFFVDSHKVATQYTLNGSVLF